MCIRDSCNVFNWYGVVNRGWLDFNSGPSISFLHTTKSNERKWFDPEFSVSRDGNPEHFHGFKSKNIWRILTQATIVGKGGGHPKHSADNDILHSSLLRHKRIVSTFWRALRHETLERIWISVIKTEMIIIGSSRRESVSFFKAWLTLKRSVSKNSYKIHLGNLQNSETPSPYWNLYRLYSSKMCRKSRA